MLRCVRPSEKIGLDKKLSMISENRESDEMVLSCAPGPTLNLARVETMADLESPMTHFYSGNLTKELDTPSVLSVHDI